MMTACRSFQIGLPDRTLLYTNTTRSSGNGREMLPERLLFSSIFRGTDV